MTTMMRSYEDFQTNLERKYGKHSIILMQVGSFYEYYSTHQNTAREVSQILNIALTRKDGNKQVSDQNPWMCGFPCYTLCKYIDLLIRKEYTVGIVEQVEDDGSTTTVKSSKLKERVLSKVYSPCIPYEYDLSSGFAHADADSPADISTDYERENVCMVYHLETCRRHHLSNDTRFFLSYVVINLSFGDIFYDTDQEFVSTTDVSQALYCACVRHKASEIICINTDGTTGMSFEPPLGIKSYEYPSIDKKYTQLEYQEKILCKIFLSTRNSDRPNGFGVIADMGLARFPSVIVCLSFLLDWLYDHCPLVLARARLPVRDSVSRKLLYNIRSFYELNFLNQPSTNKREKKAKNGDSMIDLLNKTSTRMGRRYLYHLLFSPTYDAEELMRRYDQVDGHLSDYDRTTDTRATFSELHDIERTIRIVTIGKATPFHVYLLLRDVKSLLDRTRLPDALHYDVSAFYSDCDAIWNIEKMQTTRRTDTDFYRSHEEHARRQKSRLASFQKELDQFISDTGGACTIKTSSGNNPDIQVTTTRRKWEALRKKFPDLKVVESRSSCVVRNRRLDHVCSSIQELQRSLYEEQRTRFLQDADRLWGIHSKTLSSVVQYVKHEDVMMTFAYCSKKYRYCRPMIAQGDGQSRLEAIEMRHPVIEQIQDTEVFTTNDVRLTDNQNGMLIYGLNSAGKSTTLKSIGMCVLLAQVGMFVPCSSFVFVPFTQFFTKIFVTDDIYKGESTFIYELKELKYMLDNADERSLLLCDELTSGTETFSATGLMASTVLQCLHKKCSFVFTTHLHTLMFIDRIRGNVHLQVKHFSVSVDRSLHEKRNRIVYDRRLKEGSGDPLYGIEIADAVGFDPTFVKDAFDVRKECVGENSCLVSNKRSRYNTKVIMDRCSRCDGQEALHTHHVRPQKNSDSEGYIGLYHQNRAFNLEVLCRSCHEKEHHDP